MVIVVLILGDATLLAVVVVAVAIVFVVVVVGILEQLPIIIDEFFVFFGSHLDIRSMTHVGSHFFGLLWSIINPGNSSVI